MKRNIYPNAALFFFAALFIIAMILKEPKCPSTEEKIKKMCPFTHIWTHTHI